VKNIKNGVLALLVAGLLSACAGKDFARPAPGTLVLGKTSKAEVVAKMGEPRRTNEIIKNGERVEMLVYVYARGSLPGGIVPARAMTLAVTGQGLVANSYISSFEEDSTYFESENVKQIIKGKTTRAEVTAMLGKPSGEMISPMVVNPDQSAVEYLYVQTRSIGIGVVSDRKSLQVVFDRNDIVADVTFATTGI
jgi:hypothetical protein